MKPRFEIGPHTWTAHEVAAVARGGAEVALSEDGAWSARIDRGAELLRQRWEAGEPIYGVNTGFGADCVQPVPPSLVAELPSQLVRYHGCGLGRILDPDETRAVLVCRAQSLGRGWSGVRRLLLERLVTLLREDALPRIPAEGSVGASGDLTPLSYVAAALIGEREVLWRGQVVPSAELWRSLGLEPLRLQPKEGLALMNGTAVMTGLGCLALERAERLAQLAAHATALAVACLGSDAAAFDPRIALARPHEGQVRAAAWIRSQLQAVTPAQGARPIQDPYSLRCAPQVIGPLVDALGFCRQLVETELNGANDNPLIDPESGDVLHGGNFYGGHVALAMDTLKAAVASVADLLDRQVALVLHQAVNRGLPANLSGAAEGRRPINHGLKALGIATSAWAAEAAKLSMPAAVFSRSTEGHNQDKVSQGTIAARDCLRILELSEQVLVAALFTGAQGVWLRQQAGHTAGEALRVWLADIHAVAPPLEEDRALDGDLTRLLQALRTHGWAPR